MGPAPQRMRPCKYFTLATAAMVETNLDFELQSINGAHKDWVCGLAMLHDGLLVSGCRGGILKLWATHTCLPLGEIKAHNSPINAVATNSTCIFSASKYVLFVQLTITINNLLLLLNIFVILIIACVTNHDYPGKKMISDFS
jgi:WD40 repeat protein